jgi:uncharacterized protein (DUF927 family)
MNDLAEKLDEAFAPIAANDDAVSGRAYEQSRQEEWAPVTPIPDDAFDVLDDQVRLYGEPPLRTWTFRDSEGRPLGVECRWQTAEGKEVRFACWCKHEDAREVWRLKHLPPLRPLFGLEKLSQRPDAPVLVVEGAKKCEPAEQLFPDYVAIASIGGTENVHLADWSPVNGRNVTIWPDNDHPGRKAAAKIAMLALSVGAASAQIVPVPNDVPAKWDLADPVPDGVDLAALLAAAQLVKPERVYPPGFRMRDYGLVWSDPTDEESPEIIVAGNFEVVAQTRGDDGWNWGLLLSWKDGDGREREWPMPRSLLAGDGAEVRRVLLDGGLHVAPDLKARNRLTEFLTRVTVKQRARAVTAIGWHGSLFVLPDGPIGVTRGERVVLQTTGYFEHAFQVKGTLAEWQREVAQYASGNSLLLLAISTALAAAIVGPCRREGGGIHFRGPSSTGKTTALVTAASVWGGGEQIKYVRSWRSTANGLEAIASGHNDALLCLDELGQLSARDAGETAYMLANGMGKSRANRDASGRKPFRWRLLFLSSGELSLADKIAEDGKRVKAGQQVRVVDVPADTGVHGLFEDLHGFPNAGAFARHLLTASSEFYGTAARALIEKIAPELEGLREAVDEGIRSFISANCPEGSDGQVERVAARFGLNAVAGEIAADLGVVPWQPGEARSAVEKCFRSWLSNRGGVEPAEIVDGIRALRAFISAHGSSRFQPAWDDDKKDEKVINLAGYRRRTPEGSWEYFFTPDGWKEATSGYDGKSLAAAMIERGLLLPDKDTHRQKVITVQGQKRRLYHISPRLLEVDGDD